MRPEHVRELLVRADPDQLTPVCAALVAALRRHAWQAGQPFAARTLGTLFVSALPPRMPARGQARLCHAFVQALTRRVPGVPVNPARPWEAAVPELPALATDDLLEVLCGARDGAAHCGALPLLAELFWAARQMRHAPLLTATKRLALNAAQLEAVLAARAAERDQHDTLLRESIASWLAARPRDGFALKPDDALMLLWHRLGDRRLWSALWEDTARFRGDLVSGMYRIATLASLQRSGRADAVANAFVALVAPLDKVDDATRQRVAAMEAGTGLSIRELDLALQAALSAAKLGTLGHFIRQSIQARYVPPAPIEDSKRRPGPALGPAPRPRTTPAWTLPAARALPEMLRKTPPHAVASGCEDLLTTHAPTQPEEVTQLIRALCRHAGDAAPAALVVEGLHAAQQRGDLSQACLDAIAPALRDGFLAGDFAQRDIIAQALASHFVSEIHGDGGRYASGDGGNEGNDDAARAARALHSALGSDPDAAWRSLCCEALLQVLTQDEAGGPGDTGDPADAAEVALRLRQWHAVHLAVLKRELPEWVSAVAAWGPAYRPNLLHACARSRHLANMREFWSAIYRPKPKLVDTGYRSEPHQQAVGLALATLHAELDDGPLPWTRFNQPEFDCLMRGLLACHINDRDARDDLLASLFNRMLNWYARYGIEWLLHGFDLWSELGSVFLCKAVVTHGDLSPERLRVFFAQAQRTVISANPERPDGLIGALFEQLSGRTSLEDDPPEASALRAALAGLLDASPHRERDRLRERIRKALDHPGWSAQQKAAVADWIDQRGTGATGAATTTSATGATGTTGTTRTTRTAVSSSALTNTRRTPTVQT